MLPRNPIFSRKSELEKILKSFQSEVDNPNTQLSEEDLEKWIAECQAELAALNSSFQEHQTQLTELIPQYLEAEKDFKEADDNFPRQMPSPFTSQTILERNKAAIVRSKANQRKNDLAKKIASCLPTPGDWYHIQNTGYEVRKTNFLDIKIRKI